MRRKSDAAITVHASFCRESDAYERAKPPKDLPPEPVFQAYRGSGLGILDGIESSTFERDMIRVFEIRREELGGNDHAGGDSQRLYLRIGVARGGSSEQQYER
jgi:hypothetical protein